MVLIYVILVAKTFTFILDIKILSLLWQSVTVGVFKLVTPST